MSGGERVGGRAPTWALLLDALGTIIRLEPPAPRLRAELAGRFGVAVTLEEAERAVTAEIAFYRRHLGEGRDAASLTALRNSCALVLRSALPSSDALAAVGLDALTEALLASLRFHPFPDARPAILAQRASGRRVVVASNWDVSLHEVLARLSLTPLLDGVVTSAEVGVGKPAPEVFLAALNIAQAEPGQAIHVGDSVEEDVSGARRAGIEPVLLVRDGRSAPAGVRTIASLLELGPAP